MICFNLSKCSNLLFALNPKLSQCNILSEHVQRVRHSALAPEAQPNEEQRRNRGVLAPAGARHGHWGATLEGNTGGQRWGATLWPAGGASEEVDRALAWRRASEEMRRTLGWRRG